MTDTLLRVLFAEKARLQGSLYPGAGKPVKSRLVMEAGTWSTAAKRRAAGTEMKTWLVCDSKCAGCTALVQSRLVVVVVTGVVLEILVRVRQCFHCKRNEWNYSLKA